MPYIIPSTQWFHIKTSASYEEQYFVEWSDEVGLEHGILLKIQPTISLYLHFTSIEYTNLTQKNLADYLEKVDLANNQTK